MEYIVYVNVAMDFINATHTWAHSDAMDGHSGGGGGGVNPIHTDQW